MADEILGQEIAATLPSDVAPLSEFVDGEDLKGLPDVFQSGNFIIFDAQADLSKEVIVAGAVDDLILSPVAVLTEEYEPIATASVVLLSP